jgi:hypothetical protein
MKNLVLLIMAILLINVSFAGDLGMKLDAECDKKIGKARQLDEDSTNNGSTESTGESTAAGR